MELIEEIILDNGLKLQAFDLSRVIAADTVKVEISFKVKIDLLESYFAHEQDYLQVKNLLGNELTYEHTMERTIVPKKERDAAREELIATFKNNSLKYLAHAKFAQKLALSHLRDIKLNPYKYHGRPDVDLPE
jgi:hypothetical protein